MVCSSVGSCGGQGEGGGEVGRSAVCTPFGLFGPLAFTAAFGCGACSYGDLFGAIGLNADYDFAQGDEQERAWLVTKVVGLTPREDVDRVILILLGNIAATNRPRQSNLCHFPPSTQTAQNMQHIQEIARVDLSFCRPCTIGCLSLFFRPARPENKIGQNEMLNAVQPDLVTGGEVR